MTEINRIKSDIEIRKTVDFCRDKYIIDSHSFPYCICVDHEVKTEETHYNFNFTIVLPKGGENIRFEISKTGSCGIDSSIEETVKLYEKSLEFLKDMVILKNKLMEEV